MEIKKTVNKLEGFVREHIALTACTMDGVFLAALHMSAKKTNKEALESYKASLVLDAIIRNK